MVGWVVFARVVVWVDAAESTELSCLLRKCGGLRHGSHDGRVSEGERRSSLKRARKIGAVGSSVRHTACADYNVADCPVCRLRLVSGQQFSQVSAWAMSRFALRLAHRGSRSTKSVVVRVVSMQHRLAVVAQAFTSAFSLFTRAWRGSVAGLGSLASISPQKGRVVLRTGFPCSRVERLFTRAVEVAAGCVRDDRCTAWRFNERRW